MAHNLNASVGESVTIPCQLNTSSPIPLERLRFHLQERESMKVLYSFNKGKQMPEHVDELYRNRTEAFVHAMVKGDISVRLNNLTLGDDHTSSLTYAILFDENLGYRLELEEICQATVHIAGRNKIFCYD